MWNNDDLGILHVSHLQASSIQSTQNINNVISTAMRASCDRVEKIEAILDGTRDVLEHRICQPCLSEIGRKSESTYKLAMINRKKYQDFVANESRDSVKKLYTGRSISIDKYLQNVNYEQLLTAVYDLEQEISILGTKEKELSKKYSTETENSAALHSERSSIEKTIEHQQLRENKAKYTCLSRLQLADSASREINFLRQASSKSAIMAVPVLFDRVCIHPISCGVLNGHRLTYRADAQFELNWTELSFSWASVAKLLCCVRNHHGLPKCVDFSILRSPGIRKAYLGEQSAAPLSFSSTTSLPTGTSLWDTAGGYALRILPLQDRALLLLERGHPISQAICSRKSCVQQLSSTSTHVARHVLKPYVPVNTDVRGTSFTSSVPRCPAAVGTACTSEQWTLHLEGGIWEHLPSRAAALALAEYRCAVLLLCSALVVTLLEVRTLHPSESRPTQASSSSNTGPSAEVSEWWVPMQELLHGHMRDLACALLMLGGELELHHAIADDAFSSGAYNAQSAFFSGPIMCASTTSGATVTVSPPSHASIFAFPSMSSFTGSPRPPLAAAYSTTGTAAVASSDRTASTAHHGCKTPQDEWARRIRVLTELSTSSRAQQGSGNQGLDVLSCLLPLVGLHPSGIEALMESMVMDMLKTIRQNS